MLIYLALTYGIIFFFIHYFSENICLKCKGHHTVIYSFTAGITVTYIFLKLLPGIAAGAAQYSSYIFLFPFLGFSLHHLVERHLYNSYSKNKLKKKLKREHSIIFFLYHFVVGIILARLVIGDPLNSLLFFFPLTIATIMTTISLKEIHGEVKQRPDLKIILSSSTLLGVLVAYLFAFSPITYYSLYGFVGGTLLYVVVGESIPSEKKGSPMSFVLGALLYSLVLFPVV